MASERIVFSEIMSIDEFRRLNALGAGFLKRDVLNFVKANEVIDKGFRNLSENELIGLKLIQVHVLPNSLKELKLSTNVKRKWGNQTCIKFTVRRYPESHGVNSHFGKHLKPLWPV